MSNVVDEGTVMKYVVAGGLVALYSVVQYMEARRRDVKAPGVGPSGGLSSYYGALKFFFNAKEMLQEGYSKHKNGVFKVPELERWHVIVTSPKLVEEVRKAPEDVLSLSYFLDEFLAIPWTVGSQIIEEPYHLPIIAVQLTRHLDALFDDVRDEIIHSFDDTIHLKGSEWTEIAAYDSMMNIVARASSRAFVGLPLCREPEFLKLVIKYTFDVVVGAKILMIFPSKLRTIVGELITSVPKTTRKAMKFLEPVIEERIRKTEEYGKDYPEKPMDLLSWLIDEAKGKERTVKALTSRILMVIFASIHTTTMSFTHTLYHLAAKPDKYVPAMREEVECITKEFGWSKDAISKMRILDSFCKETQRFNGVASVSLTRKVLKPYTLSDGTFLPPGTFVSASSRAIHFDPENYERPEEFDGFRFANMRDENEAGDANEGEEGSVRKHQMVTTGTEYLPFGHGKHACPGRFFAAVLLKTMLAHVVLNYDIRLLEPGKRPPDEYYSTAVVPNSKAKVLFRRRQT